MEVWVRASQQASRQGGGCCGNFGRLREDKEDRQRETGKGSMCVMKKKRERLTSWGKTERTEWQEEVGRVGLQEKQKTDERWRRRIGGTYRERCGGRGCLWWSAGGRGPLSLWRTAGWGSAASLCQLPPLNTNTEGERLMPITAATQEVMFYWKDLQLLKWALQKSGCSSPSFQSKKAWLLRNDSFNLFKRDLWKITNNQYLTCYTCLFKHHSLEKLSFILTKSMSWRLVWVTPRRTWIPASLKISHWM